MKICKPPELLVALMVVMGIIANERLLANSGPVVKTRTTYVLEKSQYPIPVRNSNPTTVYLLYAGRIIDPRGKEKFLREDTITNLKMFRDSFPGTDAFRLIFKSKNRIDSAWQLDSEFKLTNKAFNKSDNTLRIIAYDKKGNVSDEFQYDYPRKPFAGKPSNPSNVLAALMREFEIYNSYDRDRYALNGVWSLSIGISNYEGIGNEIGIRNCESDARSYNAFFKKQFSRLHDTDSAGGAFHEYILLGKNATKEAIISALKDIAARASAKDYFIFNFSGFSYFLPLNAENSATCFFPYDSTGYSAEMDRIKNNQLDSNFWGGKKLISLNTLQEYIQQIPAVNQLFISEAGPSEKFKPEFIKSLMRNSAAVASLLNKNRVIMVPNKMGLDNCNCDGEFHGKAPINYFITSLDSAYNIFDIFKTDQGSDKVAYEITKRQYNCSSPHFNYFDVFFEQQYLREYNDIFGDQEGMKRGGQVLSNEIQQTASGLTGKHYALVIGTDHYKGKGWNTLGNPIKDARAVADELANSYGFEVQLMEDKPMDTIYRAIREYYRMAKPNDQLVVYFAGHGDVDKELLSDGFIVCADSKSIEDDPVRNTYIPYAKLQKMLNNIPARQVLVLLDVCYGGSFDQEVFQNIKREGEYSNIANKNVLEFLKEKLPLRTRKFLSSVGSEPAFDGKAGRHSPFANLLLQVLRTKGAGSNGIVTLSDINAVLQTLSLNENTTLKISPSMANFGDTDPFSEFIFIPMEKSPGKTQAGAGN